MIVEHFVEVYGYGSPRDGESECSCGWTSQNDLFGTFALQHWIKCNRPFYKHLKRVYEAAGDIVMRKALIDSGTSPTLAQEFLWDGLRQLEEILDEADAAT